MNKVFLSGCIVNTPCLVHREGATAHLTFSLDVTHRTAKGDNRHELYSVNLWRNAALWAAQTLKLGQNVAVNGYLVIRRVYANGVEVPGGVEVVAEEVLAMAPRENADSEALAHAAVWAGAGAGVPGVSDTPAAKDE